MTPNITTFVFDAYGTIVHNPSKVNIYKNILQLTKSSLSPMTTDVSFSDFINSFNFTEDEIENYEEMMANEIDNIVIDQEAYNTIKKIKKAGYHIAVGSNLANPYAEPLHKFYDGLVDTWIFSFETGTQKPQMSFYIDIMQTVNTKLSEISYPDQFFMIGDNYKNDFVSPVACGMRSTFLADAQGKIDWSLLSKYY